jgi:tRNA-dihydrouridine synthase 2
MRNIWKERPKLILAPMVRIGTLPLRQLALKYGAEVVFSPEIVDKSIIGATRVFNRELNLIEYRQKNDENNIIFRCSPAERTKLIVQIGSNDPQRAVEAARLFRDDVSGIDLNCGCPKHFSTHSGMGAALLENAPLLCAILENLVASFKDLPISAKIRLLPHDIDVTKQLVKRIISTGISALSIHGRTRFQTYDDPAEWNKIKTLVEYIRCELRNDSIAIYLCGDVFSLLDAQRAVNEIGVDGVLFARAAQWNVSVFSAMHYTDDVIRIIREYLTTCFEIANPPNNSKYTVIQMLIKDPLKYKSQLMAVYKCKSDKDLAKVFSISVEGLCPSFTKSIEDVEYGYTHERQEIRMRSCIEKLLYVK